MLTMRGSCNICIGIQSHEEHVTSEQDVTHDSHHRIDEKHCVSASMCVCVRSAEENGPNMTCGANQTLNGNAFKV